MVLSEEAAAAANAYAAKYTKVKPEEISVRRSKDQKELGLFDVVTPNESMKVDMKLLPGKGKDGQALFDGSLTIYGLD